MKYAVAALIALAACGGDSTTPTLGAAKLGIESGNNQSTKASTAKLGAPVIGRMVRTASGAARFVRRGALLDGTGTVVTGSPIPGAVVCAVSIDAQHPLTPFVPCTNTDSTGHATFFFSTGTIAGAASAEIRGTVSNEPTVFDTVKATILPGLPDSSYRSTDRFGTSLDPNTSPARVFKNAVADKFGNEVAFRITPDARLSPRDTVVGGDSSRFVAFTSVPADSGVHSTVLVGLNETPIANLWYRIRNVNGTPTLWWTVCGFKLTCTIP